MKHRWTFHIILVALIGMAAFFSACSNDHATEQTAQTSAQETSDKIPAERETTLGPVHAVVRLDDSQPVLGNPIALTLTVDAAPDVVVTMPEFGDQLGKFGIADFKESESLREDGRHVYTQRYTLDLPMSGKLRTPSFAVEFTDNRNATDENKNKIMELLTDEIPFNVRSVFLEGETPQALAPAMDVLPPLVLPDEEKSRLPLILAIVLIGCVAAGAAYRWLKHPAPQTVLPPDALALQALDDLSQRDIPTDSEATDAWYVELSNIIRHYVEGRFALHAPRLTTEEFFELAKKSDALKDEDKLLIRKLLERSDRVKFTSFAPTADETRQMLSDARRFVLETRPQTSAEEKEVDHA